MREYCTSGSVRGAARKGSPYRGGPTGEVLGALLRSRSALATQGHNVIRLVWTVLAAAVLAGLHLAHADEGRRLPTIGLAIPVDAAADAPFQKALRDGLRDLGYVDGKNVTLIVRYSDGDPVKYREVIRELIALRVDVLWGEARELTEATTTIPIVSPTMDWGDPVRTGLVASLARPGGNLTGPSTQRNDIDPKLLQLTKELLPRLRRLCLVFDGRPERNLVDYANTEFRALARDLGVSLCMIPVRTPDDIRAVPRTLDREQPQAVVIWNSPLVYQHHQMLIGAMAPRLPVIADVHRSAEAGALLTYAADWLVMFRRSAAYVDKILKGAKPGDLPIEQPTKFNLVVNLRTAKALRIRVPESILLSADEVLQ